MSEISTTATKSAKTTAANTAPSIMVYAGPTISGVVTANTVFNNGITTELQELALKVPAVKALIVPVEKLGESRAQLNNATSAISICYARVLEYTKKGE